MPLTLKIVSEHAELVGDDSVREFHENGGTIGRALRNDWILPDPDRYISGRHATIDHKGGIYYLADTSSNGVYINDDYEPVGKGNVRRLFNGDRLRMGDFKFEVAIDAGESLVVPLDDTGSNAIDPDIDQMVDEVSLRTGVQLLDEDEIRGEDVFESALFGKPKPKTDVEPTPHAIDMSDIFEEITREKESAEPNEVSVSADSLLNSFLNGLGLSRADLHPDIDSADLMFVTGQALRELVKGMTDMLASRTHLKTVFRLDQTTLLPRHNNPMKFSENTNDLLRQLLTGSEGDYLGARDSIREVNQDLLHHQNALLDAMGAAFTDFAGRFDPVELQYGFDSTLGDGLLKFTNKLKYWQMFCELYPVITEKGDGRFPQIFAEEFVSAYERQITEYRRQYRDGGTSSGSQNDSPVRDGLLATQKLDMSGPLAKAAAAVADDTRDPLSDSGAASIDQSFIDELESSMDDEIDRDQLKA